MVLLRGWRVGRMKGAEGSWEERRGGGYYGGGMAVDGAEMGMVRRMA